METLIAPDRSPRQVAIRARHAGLTTSVTFAVAELVPPAANVTVPEYLSERETRNRRLIIFFLTFERRLFYRLPQGAPTMSVQRQTMMETRRGSFIGFFSFFIGVCPPLL